MANSRLEELRVLVVDHNPFDCELLKGVLKAIGVGEVTTTLNSDEAFLEIKKGKTSLVLCCWDLEPINGEEFVKAIRAGENGIDPLVPIIMVTGRTEARYVANARDAGITEFVAKPLSVKQLLSKIVEVLDRSRPFVKADGFFGPDRRRKKADKDIKKRKTDNEPHHQVQ